MMRSELRQKSDLIRFALRQRGALRYVCSIKKQVSRGLCAAKRVNPLLRTARRYTQFALDYEQNMYQAVISQPCDYDEFTDFDKMKAVSRLTMARINRLAYAGRVLP